MGRNRQVERRGTTDIRYRWPGRTGIPSFAGADQAPGRLAALPAWKAARVIKVNPDKAQFAVRAPHRHRSRVARRRREGFSARDSVVTMDL